MAKRHESDQRKETEDESGARSSVPAPVLDIAAIAVQLVDPVVGTAFAAQRVVHKLLDTRRRAPMNADAFQRGVADSFKACSGRIDGVEERLRGIDVEEAWVKGARAALMTARLEKARRMGQVLGSTLAADSPNWVEAAEFIADLEEFSEDDVRALKVFWLVQRSAHRVVEDGDRKMSTDANDYTSTWKDVLAGANKAGLGKEEWYSRCGRLSGFGLVLAVQPNQAHQGPAAMCYRLTTRAVRLMNMIGYKASVREYPKWIYKSGGLKLLVNDYDEHMAAGEGWVETPQP